MKLKIAPWLKTLINQGAIFNFNTDLRVLQINLRLKEAFPNFLISLRDKMVYNVCPIL
jgi:hypothetical protein